LTGKLLQVTFWPKLLFVTVRFVSARHIHWC